ncbi:hypothetical protein B9Z19DRAFT_1131885 [Tuber borchii]|uniref:C2H2-type domain-containing protein n=1 Tax=Tuber borchii TaxID=42251 RepID=A0A2T6ZI23_TUBBO|nr:hypothetical protein B9Z19DRAFT_1131885 [Tuber borchii]
MNSGPINGHPPPTLQDHIHQEAASHTAVVRDTDAFSHYPWAASPSPYNSPPDQSIPDSVAIDSRRPGAREGSPGRDKTSAQRGGPRIEDQGRRPEQNPYFCERGCEKTFFTRKTDLRRHYTNTAIHNSKKKLECKICGARFIRHDNFRQHMKNPRKKCKGIKGEWRT